MKILQTEILILRIITKGTLQIEYFGFCTRTRQSTAASTHRVALQSGAQQIVKIPFHNRKGLVHIQDY